MPTPATFAPTAALPRLSSAWKATLALLAVLLWTAPALAQAPTRVRVSVTPSQAAVRPGDQLVLAVLLDHDDGWHVQTNDPKVPPEWGDLRLQATTVTIESPVKVVQGPIQWPEPKTIEMDLTFEGEPVPFDVFGGQAVIHVPLLVPADLVPPGPLALTVRVRSQACDDTTCLIPKTETFELSLPVLTLGETLPSPPEGAGALMQGFDARVFVAMARGEGVAAPPEQSKDVSNDSAPAADDTLAFNVFGWSFSISTSGAGVVLLLAIAVLGGIILNFTPCVLPVIPLKIMGLTQSAGSPARLALLGGLMSLGVILFWVVIGAVIAGSTTFKAASQLQSYWWFGMSIGLFILVMGLGMLGAFSVGLPNWIYSIQPKHDSPGGAIGFGVLTAVLSTPCVAPFMGTAVGWAAFQPPAMTLTTFGAVGVGMALPYFLLSLRPKLVDKLPRTGPASELIKQVLGLLMVAVSVFFIGTAILNLAVRAPYIGSVVHWWIIAALCVVTGAWLVVRTFAITKKPARRATFSLLAVLLAALSIWWADRNTDSARLAYVPASKGMGAVWKEWTPEAFDQARADGKIVVLDFTAIWCFNCKALRNTVLDRPEVRAALSAPDVAAFEIDLSSETAPGWAKLAELREAGIPLLVIYTPGNDTPWKSNAYTVGNVLAAIEAARAK